MKRRLREAVRLRRAPVTVPVDVVINPKKIAVGCRFHRTDARGGAGLRRDSDRSWRRIAGEQRLSNNAAKFAVLQMLRAYKSMVSPHLPPSCRYVPTCSEYAMEAVERHGALRGWRWLCGACCAAILL